jgi:hypothetical protein
MKTETKSKTIKAVAAILAAILTTGVYAKGGTAKPPKPPNGVVIRFDIPPLPDPGGLPGELGFTGGSPTAIHQFDDIGILQNATVSGAACPGVPAANWGGTATLNGITITIPCNMVIQMPANTFTWADMVNGGSSLALDGSGPTVGGVAGFPSFELEVVGNIVGTKHIAGLMYISQQSLNGASGVIKRIDYATGNLEVDTGDSLHPVAIVQINDPNGRFGRAQSPDPRFSVDDTNPTIHAATGYPMCVPRTLTDPTVPGNPDDPLCPQKNRPLAVAASPCRNFFLANVVPPVSGELSATPVGFYCSQYVMKSLTDATRVASDATPDQQAPFEVGDFITFSGTLMHDPGAPTDPTKDFISAHTIEANVGIYTQPGTQPSYLAIGEFGVGTLDPPAGGGGGGVATETTARIFLEAETSDIKTPVDVYMIDVNPSSGAESNRWITPFEMTGECDPALAFPVSCLGFSGGITTQNTGPQPQRARIRATKPPLDLMNRATRNVRVVARSLCPPTISPNSMQHSSTLDSCLTNAVPVANGLMAGQYSAPVFEYIFPEGTKPGDPVVPNDFWHLPFLRFGDGMVGPLIPTPW